VQATGKSEKAKIVGGDGRITTVSIQAATNTGYTPIANKVAAGPYRDNRDYGTIPEIAMPLAGYRNLRGGERAQGRNQAWDAIERYRSTPDMRRFGKASTG